MNVQVNEHRTEFKHYRGSNGAHIALQGALDSPKDSWWQRIKKRWFRWELLTVAGRTIEKGWVIPQGLGIALILAMLSCTGILYWRIVDKQAAQDLATATRDEARKNEIHELTKIVIRLDQRLIDKDADDKEEFEKINNRVDDTQAHQAAVETVTNIKIAELKAKVR